MRHLITFFIHIIKMKIVRITSAVAAALVLFSSCGNGRSADETVRDMDVDLRSYSIDVIVKNTADSVDADSLKYWHVSGDYVLPERIGGNDITALRDSLMSLAEVSIVNDRISPAMSENYTVTDLDVRKSPAPSTFRNSLSVDYLTSKLIVWENYTYGYEVYMAHGIRTITYVNYSIADNKILSLSDLMKPGYEKPLLEEIRNQVVEKVGDNLFADPSEITVPSDFRINGTGIDFIFPAATIAPYSEGEIVVNLSVMDLDGLLTDKALDLILSTSDN